MKTKQSKNQSRAITEIESIAYSTDSSVSSSTRLSALKMLIDVYSGQGGDNPDKKLDAILSGIQTIISEKNPKNAE